MLYFLPQRAMETDARDFLKFQAMYSFNVIKKESFIHGDNAMDHLRCNI